MEDCCFYHVFELCEFLRMSFPSEGTTSMFCEGDWVKWLDEIAFWSRLGHSADRSRRRGLPSRQSIVLIIKYYIRDIEITTARMDEVSHTDTIAITITSHDDDRELGICELHSRSEWDRTTMKCLCRIAIDILTRLS